MSALPALVLLVAAQSSAADPQTIKAHTDIVAARVCDKRGFRYMLRVSPEYVICLQTREGAPAETVDVQQVLQVRP
jgi:hypothetical protein